MKQRWNKYIFRIYGQNLAVNYGSITYEENKFYEISLFYLRAKK